jgi:two-component system chemotaxis response regulator CheY
VLTDWSMPNADGLQLLRAIRLSSLRPRTPVLVLSRNFAQARVVEALKAGADGFVPKPFPPAMLREKVNRLLELVPTRPSLPRAERRKSPRLPLAVLVASPTVSPAE